jgi:D-alanine-D-alanine ligase
MPASASGGPRLRITVLCGGPSAEREVSLDSGKAVAEALGRRGHDVFVSDIGPDDLTALDHPADVIFPALHGPFGEDGTVQRLMEARGIKYVGSDARASAIAMDKVATKLLAAGIGVDTPRFEVWDAGEVAQRTASDISVPVIIKPVDQGSSVGTLVARKAADFLPIVRQVISQYGRALVEQFVDGDELTVGIVGEKTFDPVRIRAHPDFDFFDYKAKYQDNRTEFLFETGLPEAVLARAREWSRQVFDRIGCRHLSRLDWMVDRQQRVWFLEINTLPGFTSHSLVPKAAGRAGITFDELCDRLVRMALEDAA